jgi:hypothetical protein
VANRLWPLLHSRGARGVLRCKPGAPWRASAPWRKASSSPSVSPGRFSRAPGKSPAPVNVTLAGARRSHRPAIHTLGGELIPGPDRSFRCKLDSARWRRVSSLLELFANRELALNPNRFQYLDEPGPVDWIISRSQSW